ncbi:MAG: hypothetical protein ACI9Y1_003559 [Lentisphaeria bacterium]|jgi:hypothetical protein
MDSRITGSRFAFIAILIQTINPFKFQTKFKPSIFKNPKIWLVASHRMKCALVMPDGAMAYQTYALE